MSWFKPKIKIPDFRTPADAEDWFRYNYPENKDLQKMFTKNNYHVALQKFQKSEYYPLSLSYQEKHAVLVQTGATRIL